jgi:uncharacterized protein YdaU (DUF1376 family)
MHCRFVIECYFIQLAIIERNRWISIEDLLETFFNLQFGRLIKKRLQLSMQ